MHSIRSNDTSIGDDQAGSQLVQATFSAPGLVVTIPSSELETLILAKGAEIDWEAPSLVIFSDQVSCAHVVYPLSSNKDSDATLFFDPLNEQIVTLNGREKVILLDAAMAAAAPYEGRSVVFDWDARQCLETCFSAPVQKINLKSVEGERQLQRILGATLSRALPQIEELELTLTEQAEGVVCHNFKELLDAVNAFALIETHRGLNSERLMKLHSILLDQEPSRRLQSSITYLLDSSMVLTPQTIELVHRFTTTVAEGHTVTTHYEYLYHTPLTRVVIKSHGLDEVTDNTRFPQVISFWKDGKPKDRDIAERFTMQVQYHSVKLTATIDSAKAENLVLIDLNRVVPGIAHREVQTAAQRMHSNDGALDKEPCFFEGVPALVSLKVSQMIAPTREEVLSATQYVGLGSSLKALVVPRTRGPLRISVTIEFREAWDDYSDVPSRYYLATRAAVQSAQLSLAHMQADEAPTFSEGDELGSFSIEELPAEIMLWPQPHFTATREAREPQTPQRPRTSAAVSLSTALARPAKAERVDLAAEADYVRRYDYRRSEVADNARNGDLKSLRILFYLVEDGAALSRWSKSLLVDIVKGPTSSQFSAQSAELVLEKINIFPEDTKSFLFEHLLAAPKLNTWRPEPPGPWVTLLRDEVMRHACVKLLKRSKNLKPTETEQLVALLELTLPHPDVARGFFQILQNSPGGELYRLRDRLIAKQLSSLRRGGVIFTGIQQPQIERGTYALFLPGVEGPIALNRDVKGYEYTGTLSLQFDEQGNCTTPGFRTSRPLTRSDCDEGQTLPSLYLTSTAGSSIPFPFRITEVAAIPLLDDEGSEGFIAHCALYINSDWWSRDHEPPSPLLRGAVIQRDLSSWGDLFPALHPGSGMQLSSFVAPPLLEEMEWRSSPQGERSRYGKRYDAALKAWQEAARHVPSFNPEGPLVKGIQEVYRYPVEQLAAMRSSLMSPLHLHFAQRELALITAATTFHLRFLPHYFSEDERTLYERLLNESILCADIFLQEGAAPGMHRVMKFDAHLQVLRQQSMPYWHEEPLDERHSAYIDFVGEVSASMKNNTLRGVLEAQNLIYSFRRLTSFDQLAALKTISDPLFSALYSSSGVSPRLSQYYADRESYLISLMEPLSRLVPPKAYKTPYDGAVVELLQRFARAEDGSDLRFPAV